MSAEIVAEIGANFRDMREARTMIQQAQICGADAVKFQVYNEDVIEGHPRFDELKSVMLSKKKIKSISKFCYAVGIELIATPMFPDAVDWIAPHVNRFKVRYEDRHNVELFERIAASNTNDDKGVIISCDDEYFREKSQQNAAILTELRRHKVHHTYMLCTRNSSSAQVPLPHAFHSAKYIAYSSHDGIIATPLVALCRGAKLIEVHVKRNKYSNGWVPFDDTNAINMYELGQLIHLKSDMEKVL